MRPNDCLQRQEEASEAPLPTVRCKAWLAGCSFERSNGNKIMITNVPNVLSTKRDQCLCSPRCSHEFDLEFIGGMQFDYGAKVTTTKPAVWDVALQNNCVEQLEHGSPRIRRYKARRNPVSPDNPYRQNLYRTSGRASQHTTDLKLPPKTTLSSRKGFSFPGQGEKVISKPRPLVLSVAQRYEEGGFESADWMRARQQVVAYLRVLNECVVDVR